MTPDELSERLLDLAVRIGAHAERFTATLTSLGLPDGPVVVDGTIANLLAFRKRVDVTGGRATVAFDFAPTQLRCGTYPCRLAVTAASGTLSGSGSRDASE